MSSTAPATPLWPDWTGETVVCIATGPSLTSAQLGTVKRAAVRTIGINDIGLTEDWIDVWYAADAAFWKHYRTEAEASPVLKVCGDPLMDGIADRYLEVVKSKERGLRFEPGFSQNAGHSGFQALCMAISFGPKRIVLLGYDCKKAGARTNHFGTKCASLHKESPYAEWAKHYNNLKVPAGVEVLNATISTAITAFPRVSIEDALTGL